MKTWITSLDDAAQAIIETANQAPHDFCGEQREFHLPRIQLLFRFMLERFPREMAEAMERAVDGYGRKLVEDDT